MINKVNQLKALIHCSRYYVIGVIITLLIPYNSMGNNVFTDNFDVYSTKTIHPYSHSHIDAIGLNLTELEETLFPKNWTIELLSLSSNISFNKLENGFNINSASEFTLYGPLFEALIYEYEITVAISGNGKIALGVSEYYNTPRGKKYFICENISSNETVLYKFSVSKLTNNAQFRPSIHTTGDITLHSVNIDRKVTQSEGSVIQGEIIAVSKLPEKDSLAYPDCRYTAHFKGKNIVDGKSCSSELQLVIDGFIDYELQKSSTIKVGDKVLVSVRPFDVLPDEEKTTQQIDDLDLFILDNYYTDYIVKIDDYNNSLAFSGIPFSQTIEDFVSIFERNLNPPLSNELIEAQKKSIEESLTKMNILLADFNRDKLNEDFNIVWAEEKAKDKEGYNRVKNTVWRNINNSFWALPEDYTFADSLIKVEQQKIDALIAFQDMLEANGIQLIVSIVPYYYDIAARVINPKFRDTPDYRNAFLVKQLLENNIEAVYASDALIENYNRNEFMFFYPFDGHPGDSCQYVLAQAIAQKLDRFKFSSTMSEDKFSIEKIDNSYSWRKELSLPQMCDIGNNKAGTIWKCERILYDNKIILKDMSSPVFIMGNSYIDTPYPMPDAFPTYLTSQLKMPVNYKRVSSIGPMTTILQEFYYNPDILAGKKVVILQMGLIHFYTPVPWNNLHIMDNYSKLLTNRKLIDVIPLKSADIPEEIVDMKKNYPGSYAKYWDEVTDGKEFYLETEKITITNIDTSNCDEGKGFLCVIPSMTFQLHNVKLVVNDSIELEIPSNFSNPYWQNVVFQIPAGTKHLKIQATGAKNSLFALKNIIIYQ